MHSDSCSLNSQETVQLLVGILIPLGFIIAVVIIVIVFCLAKRFRKCISHGTIRSKEESWRVTEKKSQVEDEVCKIHELSLSRLSIYYIVIQLEKEHWMTFLYSTLKSI